MNDEIRQKMEEKNMRKWELADCLSVSEATITRAFRHEIEGKQKEAFLHAIESFREVKE